MTKIIAVDQATRSGYCVGSDRTPLTTWVCGSFRAPKRDADGARWRIIEDTVVELCASHDPDILVFETPYDPSFINSQLPPEEQRLEYSAKTMRFLAGIATAVQIAADRAGLPCEDYGARSWRSILEIPHPPFNPDITDPKKLREWKRKWTKKATIIKVAKLGAKINNDDEADAFGLCLYALHGAPGSRRKQGDLLDMISGGLNARG